MAEPKITIGGKELTDQQAAVVRIAIDRWSYEESVDVGSEDHERVRELKAMLDKAGKGRRDA